MSSAYITATTTARASNNHGRGRPAHPRHYDDSIDAAEAAAFDVYFPRDSIGPSHDADDTSASEQPPFDPNPLPLPAFDFRRTSRPPQPWESEGAFPIREIERMRNKTRRLRSQRGCNNAGATTTNVGHNSNEHYQAVPDDIDDGFATELAPESFLHAKIQRDQVRLALMKPPARPTPYHRVQPPPWNRDLLRHATSDSQGGLDSLDEILNASSQQSLPQQSCDDNNNKEVSQCLEPNELRLQYSIIASGNDSSSHDHDSDPLPQDHYLTRDPSLKVAQSGESSAASEQSTFVETGENPFAASLSEMCSDFDSHPYVNADTSSATISPTTTTVHTTTTPSVTTSAAAATATAVDASRMQLHDLCGEAVSTDDIAWRNALALLSSQPLLARVADKSLHDWTPLHICCMGSLPAPLYILRALLFVHPAAVRRRDIGGRLPLHLVAASSADTDTMQVLVDEYPSALMTTDEQGYTPLQLLLRNVSVELTVERVSVLLGLSMRCSSSNSCNDNQIGEERTNVLQRRRDHLKMHPYELNRWLRKPKPVTVFHRPMVVDHEALFNTFPLDVQMGLKKLSKWKRSQANMTDETVLLDDSPSAAEPSDADANPAAIPSPKCNQLAVHVVIRRAFIYRTTLTEDGENMTSSNESDDEEEDDEDEENGQGDQEVSSSRTTRPSVPYPFDILRLVVAAYPQGLVHRDSDGFTPLLLTMLDPAYVPDLAVVELLLGTRTAGAYENLPDWSEGLPLHRFSDGRYRNPAMVPTAGSGQLPLHLASEELLSEYSIIKSIRDSYPGAIHVQDNFGRTPLHTALRSYRRIAVEPRIMAALYSDRVARIRDDHGRLPVELLLDGFQTVPLKQPHEWEDDENKDASTIYQTFIVASLRELGPPANPFQGRRFLRKLRVLPPWLRQQACSSSFVQELLVQDISGPWKCALVLLDGLTIVALITVFRLQMEQYIQALYTGVLLANWYTYAVYLAATMRLILNVSCWVVLAKFGEFQHLCLLNLPTWIDTSAMFLAIVTSVLLYGSDPEEKLLSLGTAATGMLWLSLLCYLSTWFYGVAIFAGILRKLGSFLLWPVLLVCASCIAFAQMFYTQLQLDCERAVGVTAVCSMRDSYRIVYVLARGESLASMQNYERLSQDAVTLIALFLLVAALFLIGLLVALLLVASQLDFDSLATVYYWEPKLAAHFSISDLGFPEKQSDKGSVSATLYQELGSAWELLMDNLFSGEIKKRKQGSNLLSVPLSFVAVATVPIWLVLGLFSMGLLWPPQVRRALFRSSKFGRRTISTLDQAASDASMARHEIAQLKMMAFHRSDESERRMQELVDVLQSAMKQS